LPRDIVCLRNISINTPHKGDEDDDDDDDDDDDNNNNNNNNNTLCLEVVSVQETIVFINTNDKFTCLG